jgi:hypothetical protein
MWVSLVFLLHVSEEGPKERVLTVVQWVLVLDGAVLERNLGANPVIAPNIEGHHHKGE